MSVPRNIAGQMRSGSGSLDNSLAQDEENQARDFSSPSALPASIAQFRQSNLFMTSGRCDPSASRFRGGATPRVTASALGTALEPSRSAHSRDVLDGIPNLNDCH
jgi:hypothetical protein